MGIFEKFKLGFKKSASTFTSGLKDIILKEEIDDKTLDQVEDYLIESDVGIAAASEIKEIISTEKIDPKKNILNEVNIILKKYIIQLMKPLESSNFFIKNEGLKILLISGVNGVGKTTTIGKIGKILKSNNNKILFSACDTFRAAAIEQLEEWSNRVGATIIKSNAGSDPASVAFKAVEYAKQNNINCTAHAGEAKGPESIWETIDKLKVKRIGHGVKCIKDPKLVKFLYENNFHLEVCVSGNIKTKTFNKIEDHPISQINESSISMSINTDGRTISSTDLTNEYEIISNKFGWSIEDFRKSNLEAIKHAFASDELKTILADRINKEY